MRKLSVGEKIKLIREKLGISQFELASNVKTLNQSQISKIESGTRKVKESDLKEVSKALGVSVVDLIS